MLDDDDRRILGRIALESLAAALAKRPYEPAATAKPALLEKRGCFVTLKKGGELRGCLGCFTSEKPLYLSVATYARHSALEDPRFEGRRLASADLPFIEVEISALTPLTPCPSPESVVLGRHGIYVSKGGRSGCFLPQVASETNWSVEEFWGHCCRDKAGLDWNAWRDPGTMVMTFEAEAFNAQIPDAHGAKS